ncbi:MAG: UbiD family decarboxylase [Candidatus Obscuribacterales bacterium]|nr:UbiD family decarboxylase [Candidatus Obscuribacterales bacterium]
MTDTKASLAPENLAEFLKLLEEEGNLLTIEKPVDKDTELACIARLCADSLASRKRQAVLFKNVSGFKMPVAVGLFNYKKSYARALACKTEEIFERWSEAMKSQLPPQLLSNSTAAVYEQVWQASEIDLLKLPVPNWTPGKDPGAFFSSACVITKDLDSGVQNMGVYRIQIKGPSSLTVGFGSENQHGCIQMRKFHKSGKPCPVAIVAGSTPAVLFAAAAKTAYGIDELGVAGRLMQRPVKVATGLKVDLLIPAESEIVIEGFIDPDSYTSEGPFGEALGIMSEEGKAPLMRVESISMRKNAIMHGYIQQVPPSEGHLVWQFGVLGPLYYYLKEKAGFLMIKDMGIAPGSAGLSYLLVQISPSSQEEKQRLLSLLSKLQFGQKFVCLLDEDIDIADPLSIQFALSSRVNPEHDIKYITGTTIYQADYSVYAEKSTGAPFRSAIALIDATKKGRAPAIALPSEKYMKAVRDHWSNWALPELKDADEDRIMRFLRS